ncbi:MAG: hypothetical protein HYT88_03955 [Candidatus Omnitrophica bacterium]|nr:hypothetical protein [Candidatus Omnitrophota bacterium]MBI2174725.1 hypothetical protein [Candidatus Omnitrophota bacterium]MBI3010792.1 hypothetical protein [Candidatus Omnitrophota bacterium]
MSDKRFSFSWLIAFSLFVTSSLSFAAEEKQPGKETPLCPICRNTNSQETPYATKVSYTLLRGATNTLFGWTELFRQPATKVRAGSNVANGIANGVGHSVSRTLGGIGELLTFWTPKVQGRYVTTANDCPLCMKQR